MILSTFQLLPAVLAMLGAPPPGVMVSRLVIRDEVVLRVPVVRQRMAWPVRWVEKKGPKCIRPGAIAAAALADEHGIDFLMRDRRRIRAKLDSECPALDFYGGFYLKPDEDRLCAGRDEIHNRLGGTCRIARFRLMVPRELK